MSGSVGKTFAKYVSFHVLGMLGFSCYILADTFFISMGLGADGLTALNLSIPPYSLLIGIALMIAMGGATEYAIRKARGEQQEAGRIFAHALGMAAVAGILFLLAGILGADWIARAMGSNPATYVMTKVYLRTFLCFAPAFFINYVLVNFVRNDGAPRRAMIAQLVSSLSNVVLDYVFILLFRWGMFGAAFATGLSPLISMAILAGHFCRVNNSLRPVRGRLTLGRVGGILFLGVPSFITEMASGLVIFVLNWIVLGLAGNAGVAAYGVVANIALVATTLFNGVAHGIQPMVSEFHAKGQLAAIRWTLGLAVGTVLTLAVVLYGSIFLWHAGMVAAFNSENNAALAEMAQRGLLLYFPGYFFAGLNVLAVSFLTSREHPAPAFCISILRGCVILIPLAFLLAALWQMDGVWLTFPAAELLTLLVTASILIGSKKWKK